MNAAIQNCPSQTNSIPLATWNKCFSLGFVFICMFIYLISGTTFEYCVFSWFSFAAATLRIIKLPLLVGNRERIYRPERLDHTHAPRSMNNDNNHLRLRSYKCEESKKLTTNTFNYRDDDISSRNYLLFYLNSL